MKLFELFDPELRAIKRQILKDAKEIAAANYRRAMKVRVLQASDLTHDIILDLMKTADLTGKVTIRLRDGAEIVIENDNRKALDSYDEMQRY